MAKVRRDGATIKRERIKEMQKLLSKPGALPQDLDRFIAFCEFHFGLSNKKIKEYLKTIETLGFIDIDDVNNMILEVKLPTYESDNQASVRM